MGVVYILENTITDKLYIGCSKGYGLGRISQHVIDLLKNRHYNKELQKDFNYYGIDNFRWNIIDECLDTEIFELETMYIEALVKTNDLYNVAKIKTALNKSKRSKIKLNYINDDNKNDSHKKMESKNNEFVKKINEYLGGMCDYDEKSSLKTDAGERTTLFVTHLL
jgi:group I intron endonuclease